MENKQQSLNMLLYKSTNLREHFLTNPHENINPKTLKLYKSTNLRDEKRGLPLESDSLQLSSKLQSLKWIEKVRKWKFVKVGNESNGVYVKERKNEMIW
ncbi:hypothetical protein QL285_045881 [Trifolium repens]|nr:hypothetical protein QL285_045881 [Trifolium repens]